MAKQEVTQKKDQLPADLQDLIYEDAGQGMENMTKDDFAIPRLAILQALSPQAEKRGDQYVEGAEPSMIMENVSNGLYDGEEGILVIPLAFRRTIIEWGLREKNGGFIADHGLQPDLLKACTKDDKNRLINDKGNQLVDTCEYFVYVIDAEEGWRPAVISMSSTQMRKSKRWNTLIDSVKIDTPKGRQTAASYFMSYKLTTVPESNDKGSWFGWDIKKNGKTVDLEYGHEIYLAAREFKKQIDAGEVKVADPVSETVESEDSPM